MIVTCCGIAFFFELIKKEQYDYQFAMAAKYNFQEETYAVLSDYFAQFGEDINGDGKVNVNLNHVKVTPVKNDGQQLLSYNDSIHFMKLMTEIRVLNKSVYLLDRELVELLKGYSEDFFEEVCPMVDIVQNSEKFSFDEEVLKDYYICIRNKETLPKKEWKNYEKDIRLVERWKGQRL